VTIAAGFTKAGPGLLIVGKNATSNFTVQGGIARFTSPTVSLGGNLAISSGGVLEIGTDMNTAALPGDFSRAIGTTASTFQIVGSGGFSAFGGTRVVNVGGASASVNWGAAASDLLNGTFILSSTRSDSTLEFQNPITLGGFDRAIQVNNGTADVDARLTGLLSSSAATGILKTGNGTLELTAGGTYAGNTRVDGGRLLLSGSLSGTNAVIIGTGASVKLGFDELVNNAAQLRLEGGSLLTDGHSETLGPLSLSGSSTVDLGTGASLLLLSDSSTSSWTGSLNILNWSGTPLIGGGLDQIYFGFSSASLTPAQVAMIHFVNPDSLPAGTYGAEILGSGEVVASTVMVPEPGVWIMLASGFGLLVGAQRLRRSRRE
jgi:autotransporter-associated beta strand protein